LLNFALPARAAQSPPWFGAGTGVAANDLLTSRWVPVVVHAGHRAGAAELEPRFHMNQPGSRLNPASTLAGTPPPAGGVATHAATDAEGATAARAERDATLAQLLADAAGGNARAFEAFYDATVGYAQALARRMVKPRDLEDLLSDAFFQAWREAAHFDSARGSAVTWLLTIVRSRALDLLRRQRASPEVEAPEDPPEVAGDLPGPDELLCGTQTESRLHAALAELSHNERWVLGLAYYRELSHRQICDQTGLPLGTVKSLILRAQTKLRDQLATA
jgi:RNA polymerase sigma-70 factor, ECF subfamily